ncbi:MAG: hypothetical protein U9N06_02145 [candidate division WOR-3 bacterium]|nr:hypothetical protein [candidate division WOR-3 bacterium]
MGNEMNLKRLHNESNRKGSEGWASFMLEPLYGILLTGGIKDVKSLDRNI